MKAENGEAILLAIADNSPGPHSLMEQTATATVGPYSIVGSIG